MIARGRRLRLRMWGDAAAVVWEMVLGSPAAVLGLILVLVVGNLPLAAQAEAIGGFVDGAVRAAAGHGGGRAMALWVGVYVAAACVEQFYWPFKNLAIGRVRDHGLFRLQRRVLERAAAAPLVRFEEGAFFDQLQRASSGLVGRLNDVIYVVADTTQLFVWVASVGAVLALIDPVLLPLLALGTIPVVWLESRVSAAVYRADRAHTTADRVRGHLQGLLTGRAAAAEVRLFGSAEYLLGRWRDLRRARTRDVLAAQAQTVLASTGGSVLSGAGYAAGLVLVALLVLHGRLPVGRFVTVAAAGLSFEELLRTLVGVVRGFDEHALFLGDLFDFLRTVPAEGGRPAAGAARRGKAARPARPAGAVLGGAGSGPSRTGEAAGEDGQPAVAEQGEAVGVGPDPVPVPLVRPPSGGISVLAEGVTFSYPGAEAPALRGVDLRIRPGERVAVVGENGAGKTTLTKLLVGLYGPDAGSVRLDGRAAGAARPRIAAVFQDFAAYQLTVRENVGFGDPARLTDDVALWAALERADAADVAHRLPERLDGYLGREFGETELSGGQWQRVALARAFFRDADLLLLDEPTAALDPLAELALFERFAQLAEGRTTVMISHRLGAVRLADRVLVLQGGEIVEEGPHEALVARGGIYARMFSAQAQWYREGAPRGAGGEDGAGAGAGQPADAGHGVREPGVGGGGGAS